MSSKTKDRLLQASTLAKETFGEAAAAANPTIVTSVLISIALDDLSEVLNRENEKLVDCIFRSAGHIAE